MQEIQLATYIIATIVGFLGIIALFYIILAQRRKSITWKKIDYLIEDVTYKSETLTSTVETVAKISNYVDVFEVFARKNIRSASKVIANNKDDIYKILNRIKILATEEKSPPKPSKKTHKGDH